jgi:hypothetical protein
VADKLLARIKWWEHYTARNACEMNNNPSAGNKAGGLTTILEKSLGAIAKGGTTNLVGVYEYAEPSPAQGFVYMDTPGYDPVSATGQVAGGANLICFTTGRGSAYGCAPSPSLKLATNTALWQKQEDDMDINCGEIVDGTDTVEEMGERIFQLMLATASGRATKSEAHGYGQNEFVPWQLGAVMCHRLQPGPQLRHAQDRDRPGPHRHRRRHAQRARAVGRQLPHRPRHPLPDRARPAPDRGHLAVPVPRRLLAARPGHHERHRRGGHGAVGHQGQGRRHAAVPVAGRAQPRPA